MATFHERAEYYADLHYIGIGDYNSHKDLYNAYMQACADEYRCLTEWHDPNELPERDKNVIVKHVAKDDESTEYYTIGRVYGDNKWDCESLLIVYDNFKIIGWREIHE